MKVALPWPPRECSPNAREGHWSVRRKAGSAYREQAYWIARNAYNLAPVRVNGGHPILVTITFHPPDKRRRDLDNMLASLKSGLDGISDALAVNDQRFELTLKRAEPVKNGRVVIVLAAGDDVG